MKLLTALLLRCSRFVKFRCALQLLSNSHCKATTGAVYELNSGRAVQSLTKLRGERTCCAGVIFENKVNEANESNTKK